MRGLLTICIAVVAGGCAVSSAQQEVFTPMHVAKTRAVTSAVISPNGKLIAYSLRVPRTPNEDDDGAAWAELHVVDGTGHDRPFVTGKVNVSAIQWTPDGSAISFLAKRGDDKHKQLYLIPIDGGEARSVASHETDIKSYDWHPDGKRIAFTAKEKEPKKKKKLKKKGFKAEVYEEGLRQVRVWITETDDDDAEPQALDLPGSASEVQWSPDGSKLVLALAPTPLIDDHYMQRRIRIVDPNDGKILAKIENPGKLGPIEWSPDGNAIAFVSGADINDPNAGRLMWASAGGGGILDLIPGYKHDVVSIGWRDHDTVMFVSHQGCHSAFNHVDTNGSNLEMVIGTGGPVLGGVTLSDDGSQAAFTADSPQHPREVFFMQHGDVEARRLTDSNPWLKEMRLARQEVVKHKARDGLDLEGILIHPLDEKPNTRYPLILSVHGGPEAHRSNGWLTAYSTGGQLAAARGFAVFYPNYRGSTGRGVAFSKMGQSDYGGGEFNDLVDAVDHLVDTGLIDRKKVGITGGSYGGFASAWGATKLTEHFAASVMFVGISDQISKFGTTDIPNEMFLVHSRKWPWDDWDFFRERSPITYAAQARTPILILHGKNDTRVHTSQSMELYRYLKTHGNVPVRLVLYPGEGHGNRKAAGRYDYSLRLMRWMEHYLTGPGGEPPPYELDYGFDQEDEDGDDGDDDDDDDDDSDE